MFPHASAFLTKWLVRKIFFFKCLQIEISRHYLSLKEGAAFHFNKLESSLLESSPPKDALNQDWLKLVMWFLRRSKKLNKLQAGEQRDGHRTKRYQKNSFKALAQVIEKSKAYTIWQKKLNPDWLKSSVKHRNLN